MTGRDAALQLDRADPLAHLRQRFVDTDPVTIYLDGNSLGRLPVATAERMPRLVGEWGAQLVSGWPRWIDEPARVGDVLAETVLGARPGEVLIADSTTVNLFKLAAAAARLARIEDPARRVLLTTGGNFPTDRFVLQGIAENSDFTTGVLDADEPLALAAELDRRLGADVALLCLSHVDYATGARHDLAAITALARRRGVRVLWDLSHSAGSVPVELEAAGAELAVGCTYKYLNAGPGSPAYLYVRRDLQDRLRSPIWGWFGQADQFGMGSAYDPAPGVGRFAAGTPPVLGLPAVEIGARLIGEAGVGALAAKGAALTGLLLDLADAWLTPLGFRVATPRDPARRGAHVNLAHQDARRICRALVDAARVIPDYRAAPDGSGTIRLGPAPLYTRFVDVWDALDRLRDLVRSGRHLAYEDELGRVT